MSIYESRARGNAAALAEEFGFSLEDCLDFSANINPLGISQKLRACLTESIDWLVHYPDISYSRSRELLAHHYGPEKDNVLLANGAVEVFMSWPASCVQNGP